MLALYLLLMTVGLGTFYLSDNIGTISHARVDEGLTERGRDGHGSLKGVPYVAFYSVYWRST